MALILGILLSYFIGAIPTGYILGRLIKKIDIREHGSGNVGATNALRVLGPGIGITVLLIDTLKGVIPVILVANLVISYMPGGIEDPLVLRIILGIIAVLGHSLTVFLRFKGGKGMATTLGVLIGLTFILPALKIILVLEILIWSLILGLTRIVSIASIISAIFFPILSASFKQPLPLIIMSLLLSAFIIYRHKSNIHRILRKQEPRLKLAKNR